MLKKDVTFIYSDPTEKTLYAPLAAEAERRGYRVTLTEDKFARCEIGFYCQHVNFPQYSKFSLIMLHDIIQQYSNWPDIWMREPWNKYDVGILPSSQWVELWDQCSSRYYARPRVGMYRIGWPKADVMAGMDRAVYKRQFFEKYGLDPAKRTLLYAPAWENDGKQDDFVQAMLQLDVNILIKQWYPSEGQYPEQRRQVRLMSELHRELDRVTILNPALSIFDAIAVADVLVSEESSTMCEAAMMGVPAVSVSNWLIPDVTPSRYPQCNYDFVFMTTKEKLRDQVADMLARYGEYQAKVEAFRDRTFSNIGSASAMIMDIVDDCVAGKPPRDEALRPQPARRLPPRQYLRHKGICFKRELYYNWVSRRPALLKLWKLGKGVKQRLSGKK